MGYPRRLLGSRYLRARHDHTACLDPRSTYSQPGLGRWHHDNRHGKLPLCPLINSLRFITGDNNRRGQHDYSGSLQRPGQTRVLPDSISTARLPCGWVGGLDPDIHHAWPDQDLNMPVPPAHC